MTIIIAGTVGVGKSTISKKLGETLNYKVMVEPVESNPYLEGYYKDTKNFAFKMQIFMLMARSKQLKKMINTDNVIFDRSLLEDPIFVEVLKQQGNFSDVDYKTYYEFFDNVIKSSLYFNPRIKPDLIVYLKITTKNAIKRIKKRGRQSEQNVDFAYWDLLNKNYDQWYLKNEKILPYLVVDANDKNPNEILNIILKKIEELPQTKNLDIHIKEINLEWDEK